MGNGDDDDLLRANPIKHIVWKLMKDEASRTIFGNWIAHRRLAILDTAALTS